MTALRDDPTDLGIPPDLSPDDLASIAAAALEARRAARWREANLPSGDPASAASRAAARALAGFGPSRKTEQLLSRCACGAEPRRWCRGRLGFVHEGRGAPD